ncbi:hypothetical protein MUN78_11950 [Leucobacter allii]|uniref:Uncharacterized protein n=1 Tax=Leucobacter allii TaxID=2932247 RepID=A0ABY4FJY0_9MICO|nr:hypothetical protein [Leucobacter allii]UOQ56387.1 hypothetical protein MUN78_11950 [Leucobacter allii]
MSPTPTSPDETTPTAAKDDAPGETLEHVEVPDQDEESRLATHKDPTLTSEPERPIPAGHSRVEWVRPTDLAARAGTRVMERGQDLNQQLMSAVKEAAREQRDTLRQRLAARSSDVSVTGPERTGVRTPGREGVSR